MTSNVSLINTFLFIFHSVISSTHIYEAPSMCQIMSSVSTEESGVKYHTKSQIFYWCALKARDRNERGAYGAIKKYKNGTHSMSVVSAQEKTQ